jgi:hypothetical protein
MNPFLPYILYFNKTMVAYIIVFHTFARRQVYLRAIAVWILW